MATHDVAMYAGTAPFQPRWRSSAVATAKVSDAWPDGKDRGVDILAGEGLESVEIAH